jgi:hypothetical protein
MTNSTSPYSFNEANDKDIKFIESNLSIDNKKNKYSMFIRKIAPEFPDKILTYYIYEHNKVYDDKLILKEPNIFIYNKIKNKILFYIPYMLILFFSYMVYVYYI